MWKKHWKEWVGYALSAILIVLLLLIMVTLFEYFNIHVSGSRDMWIGLIGAVIGGMCTLFGVLITIYRQEDTDKENKRIENMPFLGFELIPYNKKLQNEDVSILTYSDGEMLTSAFDVFLSKKFVTIKINTLTTTVFNFVVKEVLINGENVPLGDAFAPLRCRIAPGETQKLVLDFENTDTNIFCLIRFSYNDFLGNSYYQDLPITYDEAIHKHKKGRNRQIIDIRDIQAPIHFKNEDDAPKLIECAAQYADFETFCK